MMDETQIFELGDLDLESGHTVPDARIVYQVHGDLNARRDNLIVYPTWFGGTHRENNWLIGKGQAMAPSRWCIVIPNMLGNGISTSPSNSRGMVAGADFPTITFQDQVAAQRRLVDAVFDVPSIHAVVGWSMGACQAFQWAVSFPDVVQRIFPFCGSARTSEHNKVFLESVVAAIVTDSDFKAGRYERQPMQGLRAAAAVYAAWGFSQPFYAQETYRELGFPTRKDFIEGFWMRMFTEGRDANDILSMIHTWMAGDASAKPAGTGDLTTTLGAITARTTVLAAERDLYFTAEDAAQDAARIPGARFAVIPGTWGHSAGAGLNATDTRFIDSELRLLLGS